MNVFIFDENGFPKAISVLMKVSESFYFKKGKIEPVMPTYFFKLLSGVGDRSEADIDIDFDMYVKKVKELVREKFKIVPTLALDLMVKGKKLKEDQKWGIQDVRPVKDTVLVIGHRIE
jgi:hypothetical protein